MLADYSDLLSHQLEEIQLVQLSLLPNELLTIILPDHHKQEWLTLLEELSLGPNDTRSVIHPGSPCRFKLEVLDVPLHFEVEIPNDYPRTLPLVYVRGDSIERPLQERWQKIVTEKLEEVQKEETEFIVHSVLCLNLLPLLHEQSTDIMASQNPKYDGRTTQETGLTPQAPLSEAVYHTLFTSHHLVSPTKRRNLQKWSSELSLHGFAKVGYPGCIYAEGLQADVEDFVAYVKAMQWLALRVRFCEPLNTTRYERLASVRLRHATHGADGDRTLSNKNAATPRWVEFERVGDVVEEMRRAGREAFVIEMGFGSSQLSN